MSGFKPLPKPTEPIVKIDKPHQPFGPHVDIITPFGDGAVKTRIGPNGQILSDEFVQKKNRY